MIPYKYSRPKPLVSRQYPLLSQQTQPRFPLLFDQRSPSDPCPLVNDFITQMVKGHWDSPSLLPRSQTRPESRGNSGNGRTHGGSNHFQSREQVLLPFSLGPRPGQTRGRRLGFPQFLYSCPLERNRALPTCLTQDPSPGQTRVSSATFSGCTPSVLTHSSLHDIIIDDKIMIYYY